LHKIDDREIDRGSGAQFEDEVFKIIKNSTGSAERTPESDMQFVSIEYYEFCMSLRAS